MRQAERHYEDNGIVQIETMMNQPKEENWWSRNWKWFVPVSCFSALVLLVGFVALIVKNDQNSLITVTPVPPKLFIFISSSSDSSKLIVLPIRISGRNFLA